MSVTGQHLEFNRFAHVMEITNLAFLFLLVLYVSLDSLLVLMEFVTGSDSKRNDDSEKDNACGVGMCVF